MTARHKLEDLPPRFWPELFACRRRLQPDDPWLQQMEAWARGEADPADYGDLPADLRTDLPSTAPTIPGPPRPPEAKGGQLLLDRLPRAPAPRKAEPAPRLSSTRPTPEPMLPGF